MKKPSAYLPFYGNDFFEAIAGYPDAVTVGYLRALWHYWNHTGCEGLPDNDGYLRRVCACDDSAWPNIKAILFDNRYHFRLENGLWQQPRCKNEWDTAARLYNMKLQQTAAATAARAAARLNRSKRNVQRNVQRNVERDETRYVHQS